MVLIITDNGGPGSDVSATLEVDPPSYGAFIARAMMPIEPGVGLPDVYVGGVEAQVEVASRAPNGRADILEVIAPMGAAQSSAAVTGSGSPGSGSVFAAGLGTLGLECKLANVATPVVAMMESGVAKVVKDGAYLRETRYWSRFTNGTETFGGVHWYVERRSDVDVILITLRVSNAVCHPGAGAATITSSGAYGAENPTVDGDAYFDHMRLVGLPAGWVVRADVERDSMDLSGGYVVAPLAAAGEQHYLPSRCEFVRRLAICAPADQAAADELLQGLGSGRMTGRDSYYERFAWGPTRERLPVVGDSFTHNAATGLAAARAKRQEEVDALDAAYVSGASDNATGLLVGSLGGWHHPLGDSSGAASGGAYIGVQGWPFLIREETQAALRMHASNLERMATAVIHPATGEPVTAHDLAAANQIPGDEGKQPWDIKANSGRRPAFDIAWMVASYNTDGSVPSSQKLLPTSRPWNSPDPGHTCPYEARIQWQRGTGGGRYERYDDQHLVRYLFTLRPCLWHLNDTCSRDLALSVAAYAQFAQTPYRVMIQRSSNSGSILNERDAAAANPNDGGGFARASAWKTEASLIAHGIASNAWRAANSTYWDTLGEVLDLYATPVTRTTQRLGDPTNNSPDPYESFDPTNVGNQSGNLPTNYDFAQTFEMFFVHHVAFGAMVTVFEGPDAVNEARMRSIVDGMAASIFAEMSTPAGAIYDHTTPGSIPSKFLVVSDTQDGPPLAAFFPWAFTGGPNPSPPFPGWKTNNDLYHCLGHAYRSTGNQFYLDRAAQAKGFNPASYSASAAADDFVASLGGTIFDNGSMQWTGLAALFQQ